ncbi:hypothetical protein HKX48_000878 [Thoreauomyces humboldtii]|nr:hypothetical protein HKX48_000878 [Thoreauomyces humboldtii]
MGRRGGGGGGDFVARNNDPGRPDSSFTQPRGGRSTYRVAPPLPTPPTNPGASFKVTIKERAVERDPREGWNPSAGEKKQRFRKGNGRKKNNNALRGPSKTPDTATTNGERNATADEATDDSHPVTTELASSATQSVTDSDSVSLEEQVVEAEPQPPKESLITENLVFPPDVEIWTIAGEPISDSERTTLDLVSEPNHDPIPDATVDGVLGLADPTLVRRERTDPTPFSHFLDSGHPPHTVTLCLAGRHGAQASLTGTLLSLDARGNLYMTDAEEATVSVETYAPPPPPPPPTPTPAVDPVPSTVDDIRMDDLDLDADPFALIDDFYDDRVTTSATTSDVDVVPDAEKVEEKEEEPVIEEEVETRVVVVRRRGIKDVLVKGERVVGGICLS